MHVIKVNLRAPKIKLLKYKSCVFFGLLKIAKYFRKCALLEMNFPSSVTSCAGGIAYLQLEVYIS